MEAAVPERETLSAAPEHGVGVREEERIYVASQWQLMWWRFRKHKMALVGVVVLVILYFITLTWEFLAPYDPHRYDVKYAYAPPQLPHFFDEEGFHLRPFVYGLKPSRDPETLRMVFEIDKSKRLPLYFFVHGDPYKFWGIWETDLHLFGLENNDQVVFILGADRLGRDVLSRILAGTRISTTIGLVGVTVSFLLGILIGGISGYYGGTVDTVIQRIIEFIRSMPTIPLWLALSAAVPKEWPPVRVYFAITVILSLIGWTWLARTVRGRFLALREEDFVMAARLAGSSEMRIIWRHMVPSFLSYIIAAITLAIPNMILSETSLSFLGLGIRPPAISWGVLLQEAQNLRAVAMAPWLLIPGLFVVVTVLAFNFVGDGLRDAADPYAR
ncbi:MAG TPA: ABC transporter permease [Caldilineae bacterium]|nr:ABC transporter permease [Caldilineae bacterium]